jgi:hypothetical protein
MRKKQLRKNRFRHKLFEEYRKIKEPTTMIIDSNGHEIILNFAKHLIFNKPYKNQEYQRELIRHVQKSKE